MNDNNQQDNTVPLKTQVVSNIPLSNISANPFQPRALFDDDKLSALADSIKRYGVLQPIVVTKKDNDKYEIIAGERRFRASKLAGLNYIPAIVKDQAPSNEQKFELAIIENLQREDLNPVDKARAFAKLSEEFSMTHGQIAEKMGKSREYISNSIRILSLSDKVLDALSRGLISEGHTRALLLLKDRPFEQNQLLDKIIKDKLTIRSAERMAKNLLSGKDFIKPSKNKILSNKKMIETQLSEKLGAKVHIDSSQTGGGKLTIEFLSDDDLEKLLDLVNAKKENENSFVNSLSDWEYAKSMENTENKTQEILQKNIEIDSENAQSVFVNDVAEPNFTNIDTAGQNEEFNETTSQDLEEKKDDGFKNLELDNEKVVVDTDIQDSTEEAGFDGYDINFGAPEQDNTKDNSSEDGCNDKNENDFKQKDIQNNHKEVDYDFPKDVHNFSDLFKTGQVEKKEEDIVLEKDILPKENISFNEEKQDNLVKPTRNIPINVEQDENVREQSTVLNEDLSIYKEISKEDNKNNFQNQINQNFDSNFDDEKQVETESQQGNVLENDVLKNDENDKSDDILETNGISSASVKTAINFETDQKIQDFLNQEKERVEEEMKGASEQKEQKNDDFNGNLNEFKSVKETIDAGNFAINQTKSLEENDFETKDEGALETPVFSEEENLVQKKNIESETVDYSTDLGGNNSDNNYEPIDKIQDVNVISNSQESDEVKNDYNISNIDQFDDTIKGSGEPFVKEAPAFQPINQPENFEKPEDKITQPENFQNPVVEEKPEDVSNDVYDAPGDSLYKEFLQAKARLKKDEKKEWNTESDTGNQVDIPIPSPNDDNGGFEGIQNNIPNNNNFPQGEAVFGNDLATDFVPHQRDVSEEKGFSKKNIPQDELKKIVIEEPEGVSVENVSVGSEFVAPKINDGVEKDGNGKKDDLYNINNFSI